MTTATTSARSAKTRATDPRPSRRLALDPYRVEDITWTRTELLRARGQLPEQRAQRRYPR